MDAIVCCYRSGALVATPWANGAIAMSCSLRRQASLGIATLDVSSVSAIMILDRVSVCKILCRIS